MVRYIKSNDYESGAEYAFAYAPHIFGYKFFSTMTGITIMFCNENQNYLHRHIKTIYDFLMNDEDGAEKLFWDDEESLKAQSYYFNNLCGYSISTIKPFKEYIEKLNAEKEGNIFNGTKQSAEEDFAEDSLDWLNDL